MANDLEKINRLAFESREISEFRRIRVDSKDVLSKKEVLLPSGLVFDVGKITLIGKKLD